LAYGINWVRQMAAAVLVCGMLTLASPAAAAPYSQLIVFGDSLSDVGNNGRYTDGYLWDEHLAGALGVALTPSTSGGTDYAVSGALITAGSDSLPNQVSTYLTAHHKADPLALYAIWGGGNDAFSTLSNPSSAAAITTAGVADTVAMIQALHKAGARHFVVINLPHTDLTPLVRGLGASAMAQQAALVASWNTQLTTALKGLHLPAASLLRYDTASALQAVVNSPTHFAFTNYIAACNGNCADPAHTLFWDDVHPASTGHAQIGSAVLALVTQ